MSLSFKIRKVELFLFLLNYMIINYKRSITLMSMLNIAKKLNKLKNKPRLKETQRCNGSHCSKKVDKLFEAKADTQRLIDFAGEDLAKRFLAIKDKLKSPENDLYYWIKNKTVDELEQAISAAEGTKSNTQMKKDIADQGAELVADTAHWRVYHITTFAASQKYGRDSQWCITGVNNYGDRYWKQYTERGVEFYFFITKGHYDPRGQDSKFAVAVYPGHDTYEVFDQQDRNVGGIEEIPFSEEVTIPGLNFDDMVAGDADYDDEAEDEGDGSYCEWCYRYFGDDYNISPNGEYLCDDCFGDRFGYCSKCEEAKDLGYLTVSVYGDAYCDDCFEDYMESDKSWADSFIIAAEDDGNGYFEDGDEKFIDKLINIWVQAKAMNALNLTADEITKYEQKFINSAAKDGITIDPARLEIPKVGKPIAENEQWKVYKATNLGEGRQIALYNGWTEEDMDYSELQCWYDEKVYNYGKVYIIMSKNGRPHGYSGNDVGAYFLHISPDGSFNLQEDDAYWCDETPSIKGLEDTDIEGFKFPKADEDGMFYTQEGKHSVFRGCAYETATKLKTYTVKPGTTKIGYEALYNADNLERLTIPSSVIEISDDGIPEDTNATDYKVICNKDSYAETYCKEHNIPIQLKESFVAGRNNKLKESYSVIDDFRAYEHLWD